MTSTLPLLAHIGQPNNPWIGVVTVASWVLMVVFILVVTRRIQVTMPGDLLLPMASVVLVAGLTGSLGDAINDQGPWSAPIGLVVLIALLAAAFGSVDLTWGNRAPIVTIVAAGVAAAALFMPLENLWFPTGPDDVPLPIPDDAAVTAELVEPMGDDGRLQIRVTLEGASFNDGQTFSQGDDPEEGVRVKIPVGPIVLNPPIPAECAEQDRCTEAVFEVQLPESFVTDPPATIEVELLSADSLPFAPPVRTDVPLETAG